MMNSIWLRSKHGGPVGASLSSRFAWAIARSCWFMVMTSLGSDSASGNSVARCSRKRAAVATRPRLVQATTPHAPGRRCELASTEVLAHLADDPEGQQQDEQVP